MIPARLPWHDAQWARVAAARERDRVPHALLLRGPRGTGKLDFARRLAAALLCARPHRGVDPCGECAGCRLSAAGTHPDAVEVTRLEDKREILVDQIRELIREAELTARFGGFKPVLVHPADALNRYAANTLLKTLEEPLGASVFALVAESAARLPATVRSRCQRLDFAAPDRDTGRAWLAARIGADAPIDALLDEARGAPLEAAAMHEAGALDTRAELVADALALAADRLAPAAAGERWKRHGAGPVAGALAAVAEALVRERLGVGGDATPPGAPARAMQALAPRLDLSALFELSDRMGRARAQAEHGQRLNEQLAVEALAIEWYDATRGGPAKPGAGIAPPRRR